MIGFVEKMFCGLVAFGIVLGLSDARAGDSHAEYYYPQPQTREVYASRNSEITIICVWEF